MTLQRRYIERKKQTKAYYSPITGNMYSEVSRVHKLEKYNFVEAIGACDTDVLYMLPQPKGSFMHQDSLYPTRTDIMQSGIEVVKWYDDSGKILYNGRELDIIPVKRWLDATIHTGLKEVVIAMKELETLLNEKFCIGHSQSIPVELLETPTRTGTDLLRRKLPFNGVYTNLTDEIESIVMSNFSQQRREVVTHEGLEEITDLACYDGRLMYGACCRDIPIGQAEHDTTDLYVPYVPALYRVLFTVPDNWYHIGLLPVKSNIKGMASMYPNKPQQEYESWCSTYELKTAIEHGWKYKILERVLWEEGTQKGFIGKEPLRHWLQALIDLREVEVPKRYQEPVRALIRGALRHLIIDSIGALHSSEKFVDMYSEDIGDIYEMGYIPDFDGLQYHAKVKKSMTPYQRQMFHPHWALSVWCKAKDKVTKVALSVPYDQLVLIRADAIWTIGSQEHLKDDGKIGTFREKPLVHRGPFKVPKTENAIRRMMTQAKGDM